MEGQNMVENGVQLSETDLQILKELREKKEQEQKLAKAREEVKKLGQEYAADPARKAVWEAGLGKKLEENPNIVNDQSYLKDMFSVYLEKAKSEAQAAKPKEESKGWFGNNTGAPIDQSATSGTDNEEVYIDLRKDSQEDLMKKGLSFTDALLGKAASRFMK